jgi:phosphatidylethanolamine-binding protein (PEBP) family uncharacterized protein
VLGLKPTVKELRAGQLPAGAVVGRNSAGQDRYYVCPPKGKQVEYGVFVYAFPHALHAHRGFSPVPLAQRAQSQALGFGLIGFTTQR